MPSLPTMPAVLDRNRRGGINRSSRLWLIFGALVIVFSLGASWEVDQQTRDSLGVALPAWNLVENGSLDLAEYSDVDAWIVESETGYFTNRTPGLIAIATAGYLLASPWVEGFVVWPATLIAVLTSAGAVAVATAATLRISRAPWVVGVVTIGLGTATWGIASDQIWPHGPAALFIAVAVLAVSRNRLVLAGFAFAPAILIRPTAAIIAAVLGLGLGIMRRRWRPILQIGVPSLLGAALYAIYVRWMLGSWSPMGLYEAQGGLGNRDSIADWVENVVVAFFAPSNGLFIWSPWILVALVVWAWRRAEFPDWTQPALWAGFIYIVVHSGINRVSGGLPFNYRYQLEAVALVAPLLVAALWTILQRRPHRVVAVAAVVVSIGLQFAFVAISSCVDIAPGVQECHLFGA